uniref:Uncharacterized protein n=1 Tax=Arundo donax TaxID=35708 RepID=A0A0A8YUG3_ARUDO
MAPLFGLHLQIRTRGGFLQGLLQQA